jgi:hypothetical protein
MTFILIMQQSHRHDLQHDVATAFASFRGSSNLGLDVHVWHVCQTVGLSAFVALG